MKAALLALGLGVLGLATAANAAVVISAVGDGTGYDQSGNAAKGYRSTNVAKGFDVNGDVFYGIDGYFLFGIGGGANINSQPFSRNTQVAPSWVTAFAQGANFGSVAEYATYTPIDNPTLEPAAGVADWPRSAIGLATDGNNGANQWVEIMTFDVDASAPSFRLGIMAGNEANADGRWDPGGLRLSFDGGAAVTVASLPVMNSTTIGMVFYDVTTDGTAGTFSIEGIGRFNSQGPSIAGLTFDVPSTTIIAVGDGTGYDETGATAAAFRSTDVPKGFDGDGDDAYGTAGYFFMGNGVVTGGGPPTSDGKPSWVSAVVVEGPGSYAGAGYDDFDNPTLPLGAAVLDWTITGICNNNIGNPAGRWASLLSFTVDATTPPKFRVGILAGNEPGDGRWDPVGLRLSFAGGTATEVTGLPLPLGWVFFDVSLPAGTVGTFLIEGQNRDKGGNTKGPSLAGVTFDVVSPDIVISAVGDGTGYDETGIADFRSTGVSKGFDIDGDNAYGTEGLFFFGDGVPNDASGNPFTVHTKVGASWASNFSAGSGFKNVAEGGTFSYTIIDDPSLAIAADVANWGIRSAVGTTVWNGGYQELVTFDIDDTAPEHFRIGIMAGNANNTIWNSVALRLSVAAQGSAQVVNLPSTAFQSSWVFFNVAVRNGTTGTFSLEAARDPGGTLRGASIAGITFEKPTQGTLFMIQ